MNAFAFSFAIGTVREHQTMGIESWEKPKWRVTLYCTACTASRSITAGARACPMVRGWTKDSAFGGKTGCLICHLRYFLSERRIGVGSVR